MEILYEEEYDTFWTLESVRNIANVWVWKMNIEIYGEKVSYQGVRE